MENRFPRKDRYPRQYLDAWTTCTRCKKQTKAFGDEMHYIDGFPYCNSCFQKVKSSYLKS